MTQAARWSSANYKRPNGFDSQVNNIIINYRARQGTAYLLWYSVKWLEELPLPVFHPKSLELEICFRLMCFNLVDAKRLAKAEKRFI